MPLRVWKIANWLLFGNYKWKARIVSFLEIAMREGKNVEVVANKDGEITLRFRKEF